MKKVTLSAKQQEAFYIALILASDDVEDKKQGEHLAQLAESIRPAYL